MIFSEMTPRHKAAFELLCIVIHDSPSLRHWFNTLVTCPSNLRTSILLQMTSKMYSEAESPELIDAISALIDPNFLNAVSSAVKSLG